MSRDSYRNPGTVVQLTDRARRVFKDEELRDVIHGSSVALIWRVLGAAFGFCFNILLARILGADGTGVYYLALTAITIATVFGRFGLDTAVLRFASAAAEAGNWPRVAGVRRRGFQIVGLSSGVVASVLFVAAPWIAQGLFDEARLSLPLRIMALAVIPTGLLFIQGELLKAIGRPGFSTFLQGAGLSILKFIVLGLLYKVITSVEGVAWVYVGVCMTLLLFGAAAWRHLTPRTAQHTRLFPVRTLVGSSWPLFWVAVLMLFMNSTDTIFLGMWRESGDVGVYGAARRTALLISFLILAINTVVAPKFSAMFRYKDLKGIERLTRQSAVLGALVAAPPCLLFMLWPEAVLKLFGTEFVSGSAALAVLAIGQFINVVTGSCGYILIMTGHEQLMRNNVIVTLFLKIALDLSLIPSFGVMGAALSSALALVAVNLIAVGLVNRRLGIVPLPISPPAS